MSDPTLPDQAATRQTLAVHAGEDFFAVEGVAEGDAISFADELVMDDVYQLRQGAVRHPLTLLAAADGAGAGGGPGSFVVAEGSRRGAAGRAVHLDCCLTLMAPDGTTLEALVLVEVEDGGVADIHLLPLAPLAPGADYRLVGADRDSAVTRLAEVACVSFTRGTHITMASGEQRPIEDLRVGDKVLTRDDGPQAIRWIGQTTLRAVGDFSPIVIRKGTLHNENDLVVSPDHRIFVWQRQDTLGAGRAEVLVKVRHLVNGTSVVQREGGFVDYFQLLFDEHQIIYAEGIAAESLLIDPRTRAALPPEAGARIHARRRHHDYELRKAQLEASTDPAALLRRATSG
ncbi:Hint domain-containing protein [Wenxinia saemankumensis]|uniref:Hint domain-containing protein n=1 Tax=Wenxinia saemankumensis TaxID=1447782 RepID=A0A1M6CWT0_9RHOB|nr:Hint domain-containing protein [Wenxinia saemankumensis]SHI65301.1 Hint domain-containing protein [Wenxinia saemankumensis]